MLALANRVSAQNYFYTSLKIPLLDYIGNAINNRPVEETDGISFNAGYAIQAMPDFYIETGLDYLIVNTFKDKKYTDLSLSTLKSELDIFNSAFAFQLRPAYKKSIDADD